MCRARLVHMQGHHETAPAWLVWREDLILLSPGRQQPHRSSTPRKASASGGVLELSYPWRRLRLT